MNNIFSNFLNTLFKEFTNGLLKFLGYCEEINFNELNVFLFYVTGFSILFLLLKFIVG